MKWRSILSISSWKRIGIGLAGLFFMLLGILLLAPLPLDGEWTWDSYIGSPWLGFLIGFPVFILGLWVFIGGMRSKPETSQTTSVPLIDEWIGEQGKEEEETSECQKILKTNEKLLALVAARGEQGFNRLAVTDKRVVIYSQGKIQSAVSYDFGQIDEVKGNRNAPLIHLGEINMSARGSIVSFKNVGMEYVDQVVALISRMKR
jgi:hypothetical protein